jgi:hypothetical protein
MIDLWDYKITDRIQIKSSHMFHRTKKDTMRKILSNGFDPTYGPKEQKVDEKFLKAVAESENSRYPVDRTISTFFYPNYEQISAFGGRLRTGLIVVDSSKISHPMYVADMDLYDSVISLAPRDVSKVEKRIFSDKQISTALAYLESITKIQKVDKSVGNNFIQPEVIVEGAIETSDIVGVILEENDL